MDDSTSRSEYDVRINRAIDYLERNLSRGPRVAEIARAAGISTYHFHRLFSAHVGESVGQFKSRLTLERAAARLLDRTHESITEIALDLGFTSSATFARSFRAHFGFSASDWRKQGRDQHANARVTRAPTLDRPQPTVRIEQWDAFDVAYVRHVGVYAGNQALFEQLFERLRSWAEPLGIVSESSRWVSLYHDVPEITAGDRLRLSVGLVIDAAGFEPSDEVSQLGLEAGRWAVAPFELAPSEYAEAWSAVYRDWLPSSGYLPAHQPSIEMYPSGEPSRPGTQRVEICVPIEPINAR